MREPAPSRDPARPVFHLTLRAEPGVAVDRALRRLLKFALRRCGLRCTSVEEVRP